MLKCLSPRLNIFTNASGYYYYFYFTVFVVLLIFVKVKDSYSYTTFRPIMYNKMLQEVVKCYKNNNIE